MSVFALETLDPENLTEFRRRAEESTEANPLELALRLHSRPEPFGSALFAGALMADLGRIPLRVSHDLLDEAVLADVFRSGLAAALGSRNGLTTFADPHSPLSAPELGATWTPGLRSFRAAMFGAGDVDAGLFGPRHAVFLNPHRTTTPPGPASITAVVRRWLDARLPAGESSDARLADIGFALDQLVVNVTEHAVTDHTPSVSSLARIEIDDGDDGKQARALVLVVLDTGAGIARTLRAKLSDPPADAELLRDLLAGELEQWGRARGIGLSRLTQLVQVAGGTMFVASGDTTVSVGDDIDAAAAAAATTGSIISLRLPL